MPFKPFTPNATRTDPCGGMLMMGSAKLVLNLPGDTPTTDRIWAAFHTYTPVAVVESDLPSLLPSLPFRSAVPWEQLLVVIDDDRWQASPVDAVLEAAEELGEEGWTKKHELMRKHAPDVLWGVQGSRAHLHLLREAAREARSFDV